MSNLLQVIQDKIGAEHYLPSCSKDKCNVDLNGTPSPHLIDDPESKGKEGKGTANHSFDHEKKCDLIFFFQDLDGNLVTAPLELKTGEVKAILVREQLQAGVCFAEHIISKSGYSICQPILFHAGNLDKFQQDKLNQAKIHFRGLKLTIQTAKCGQPGAIWQRCCLVGWLGQSQGKGTRKAKPG